MSPHPPNCPGDIGVCPFCGNTDADGRKLIQGPLVVICSECVSVCVRQLENWPHINIIINVYISSSWKNRENVRQLAKQLEEVGYEVYDFTNPKCRKSPEIPPEAFPEQFDPEKHIYREYISSVPAWREAVEGNREALDNCDAVVLLLPCGLDAHADAFYALGKGKHLIVCGQPKAGERTPTHLWADRLVDDFASVLSALKELKVL